LEPVLSAARTKAGKAAAVVAAVAAFWRKERRFMTVEILGNSCCYSSGIQHSTAK
jgi:hypothetical protein